MAKKIRKRRANYFDDGGFSWQKGAGFGKNMSNAFDSGVLGGAIGAAGSMVGQGISGGLSSGTGNAIQGLSSIASAIPGPWGAVAGAGLNIVGGLVNKAFGSQINKQAVQEAKAANTQQSNMRFVASNTTDLLNQSNFGLLNSVRKSDIGKDGWFSNKAKRLTNEINRQRDFANQLAIANFGLAADNLDEQNNLNTLANYAAYGGPLTMRYTGTMSPFGNTFADGGNIHISPSKRGTFTAAAKKHGKSVQAFASQVLANKENYSPAMVKKANFARNAGKWKHEEGGPLKKKSFEDWYKTVPVDRNDTISYNLRRAYELAPYNELEAWRTSSIEDLNAGKNHLRSVYRNPNTGVYEFMKSKNHPTLHFEIDWYNSNNPEAVEFRKNYDLDMSGDYYKYVPKKKAFGGDLNTNGGDFSNGLIMIGNGGTHEENPMEGVQMGMDAQGVPNLVEEGEVIFDDYVFSDRMNVPNSMRSSLGLSKGKDLTFAKAAKKLSKEAEERPNDPISERGLISSMVKLQQAQELIREQEQMKKEGKKYAHGGRMGTLFDGMGKQPQSLNPYERFMSTYGQSPFTTTPNYVAAPDDNELLDVARVYNNEAPLGTGTSMVAKSARGIIDNSTIDNLYSTSKKKPNTLTNLRYAPVLGAAIGLGQNLFSKPDYSGADIILNAANQMGNYTPTSYTPIGDYIQYNPLDRNYFTNKLNAQSGAARRAIVNQSAGNRAVALAGLVASDYNTQSRLGDFVRQAEEYNQGQRERVAAFNRGTNQVNAEMGLKSAMANQEAALKAKSGRLSGMAQAIAMRDAIDARRGSAISANLTNFFNSLGDIGREEVMKAWVNENPALLYGASTRGDGVPYKGTTRARGGYLTIRKGGKRG